MKSVKVILIAVEIAALIGVISLSFCKVSEDTEFFKSAYISLLALLAVCMQKEQQAIDWEEDEEEQMV